MTNNKRWIFKWKACCTKQAIVRKFDAENSKCIVGLSRGDSYEEELILIVKKHFVKFRLTYYSPGWKTRILILKLFDFKPNTNTKKSISNNNKTSENKIQLVEYVVSSTEKLNYEKCKAVIKNLNTHRAFLDYTEKSKVLKTYNSTEWLIYYFFCYFLIGNIS